MQPQLTGQEVLIGFGIIAMALVLIIALLRTYFKSTINKAQPCDRFSITQRVKYASVDVFKHTKRFFGLALSLSLLVVICGFSWTTYDRTYSTIGVYIEDEPIIQVEPPIIPPAAPKPPTPPPPVIEEIPEIDMDEEPDDLPDAFIEEGDPIVEEPKTPAPAKSIVLPPPPAPIKEEVAPIFKVVEQMPLFGGCSDQACSDKALMQFLYKNLKYPSIAKENGVEGKVFIQFVVEKDGSLTDVKIVRDAGAGLGEASMKAVNRISELPKAFEPGRQRGEAVRVLFTLPLTFKLTQ